MAAPTDGYLLQIVKGKGHGRRYPLLEAATTLGREKVDILLDREDTVISRYHGLVEVTEKEKHVIYTDKSSHGSTLVRAPRAATTAAAEAAAAEAADAEDARERIFLCGRSRKPGVEMVAILRPGDALVMGGVTLVLRSFTSESVQAMMVLQHPLTRVMQTTEIGMSDTPKHAIAATSASASASASTAAVTPGAASGGGETARAKPKEEEEEDDLAAATGIGP